MSKIFENLIFIICLIAIIVGFHFSPENTYAKAEYQLKLSEANPKNSEPGLFNKFFARRVENLTNGKMKIKVYYGGSLGSEKETVGMVQMGTLAFTRVGAGNISPYAPEIQAVFLPYLFDNRLEASRVLRSAASQPLVDAIAESGLRIVTWNLEEDRCVFNDKKPIYKPKDLNGLKIRVPSAKIQIETLKAMGANASPGPWPELYTSLKTGVFDGAENGINVYLFGHFYEVCKYFSYTNHFTNACPIVMNNNFYNNLPKNIKDAIDQAGKEAMIYQEGVYDRGRVEWVKYLQDQGAELNEVDLEAFRESVKPVYEKFKKEIGKNIVDPLEQAAN